MPAWYTVPLRVALITFILTLLSFAVCLFVAILWTVVAGWLHGVAPDMRLAYRHIALPSAIVIGSLVLVGAIFVLLQVLNPIHRCARAGRCDHQ